MFTRWVRLFVVLVVGVLTMLVVPVASVSAAEGGQLELTAWSSGTQTYAGSEHTFRSAVRNTGTTTLHDVTITQTLPAGVELTYYEGSYTNGDNGDRNDEAVGQVITFFFATLEPGERANAGVGYATAKVPDIFPVGHILMGRVTAFAPDSVLPTVIVGGPCADDPSSACLPIEVVAGPRFAFSVEADTPTALPGDTVRFSVSLTNTSSLDGPVFMTGYLPDALEFVESEVFEPKEFMSGTRGYDTGFYEQVEVSPGETLEFGVVTTLESSAAGGLRTFALHVSGAGIQTSSSPCDAGLDLLDEQFVNGCAAILVPTASAFVPPAMVQTEQAAAPPAEVAPAEVLPTAVPPARPTAVPAAVAPDARVPARSGLAYTGTDSTAALAVVAAGLLLTLLGAVLLLASRVRRTTAHRPEPARPGEREFAARLAPARDRRRRRPRSAPR